MSRVPAVAGKFYPGRADELHRIVAQYSRTEKEKITALGIVAPHAGYVYSGAIAGRTFARVAVPPRVVILGPNHHGLGHQAAVYAAGGWMTPLGEISVDQQLSSEILAACPDLAADELAHKFEHSLEVQVPFIQVAAPLSSIVPICLGGLPLETLLRIGKGLAQVLSRYPKEVLIVASSDMTHYEPGPVAKEKDLRALQRIIELDPQGLYQTVRSGRISMCGVLPVVVMLTAAIQMDAQHAELVYYGNSGDVTGDQSEVVGYAGVIVS